MIQQPPNQPLKPRFSEVSHVFINQYDTPGQRKDWKEAVYRAAKVDINVYNYPLEGTVNESPVYLSELPDLLSRVQCYPKHKAIAIGHASHPLLVAADAPEIRLPISGLVRHGVTLGDPGNGKTNADLILLCESTRYLERVLIMDASGGIASKLDVLPPDIASHLSPSVTLEDNVDSQKNRSIIEALLLRNGPLLLEANRGIYAHSVRVVMESIIRLPDVTKANRPRELKGLLIIQEASDVVRTPGMAELLTSVLDQSFRKGWAIWLSLQRPTAMAVDNLTARRLLKLFSNRIMFRLQDQSEIDFLRGIFLEEGMSEADADFFGNSMSTLDKFCAVCSGVVWEANEQRRLPPVPTTIRYLQPASAKNSQS